MKKTIFLIFTILFSITLISCSGSSSSSASTTTTTTHPAADKSTNICIAATEVIDDIVSPYFASISSASFNVTTSTYTMVGTRSGVSGNYTQTFVMTFTNRTFSYINTQGVTTAITLNGGCNVVYNRNTTAGTETYTITPSASSLSLTYGAPSDINTIASFNIVNSISANPTNIAGTATVSGVVVTFNYTW